MPVGNIKMGEKTLKFNNIKENKKGFHKSKQVIELDLVDTGKIVASDRSKMLEKICLFCLKIVRYGTNMKIFGT